MSFLNRRGQVAFPVEASEHATSKSLSLEFLSSIRYMTIYMVRSVTWMRSIWRTPKPI